MTLIISSLITGFIGLSIGVVCGEESLACLFGVIGFLSPGLFVLQQIYDEIKKKSN